MSGYQLESGKGVLSDDDASCPDYRPIQGPPLPSADVAALRTELEAVSEEMRIAGFINDRIKKTTDDWSARIRAVADALP